MYVDLFALHHPDLIIAFIAHAAPMPSKRYLTDERFDTLKAAGTKVILIQSKEDPGVPFENSQKMHAAYLAHDILATLIETTGAHYPAPATRAKIKEWMDTWRN